MEASEASGARIERSPATSEPDSDAVRFGPGRVTLPGPEVLVALRRCPRRWITLLRRHDLAMDLMNFRIDLDISENIANANTGSLCMPRRRLAVEFS